MAIKKDAAKADIGPKKQIKATFAECKAENPLKCKYHGQKALSSLVSSILKKHGQDQSFSVDKAEGHYELTFPSDAVVGKAWTPLMDAIHEKGFSIQVGKDYDSDKEIAYEIYPLDGTGFEETEGESELQDADTLSVENAPDESDTKTDEIDDLDEDLGDLDTDLLENFDSIDDIAEEAGQDLEALLESGELDDEIFGGGGQEENIGFTDEDAKELHKKDNESSENLDKELKEWMNSSGLYSALYDENLFAKYKEMILDGTLDGEPVESMELFVEKAKEIASPVSDFILEKYGKKASAGEAGDGESAPTMKSLTDEMQDVISKVKSSGMDLMWNQKKAFELGEKFEKAVNAGDTAAAGKALSAFKTYVDFLENGGGIPEETDEDAITESDIKEFFEKCGIKKESLLSDANLAATKDALATGKWNGKPLTKGNKKWYEQLAKKAPDHKVAQAIHAMIGGTNEKMKPKKIKAGSAAKMFVDALEGNTTSMASNEILKPLEHDESAFPQGISQKELDKAIGKGKELGGHGGLGTRLIELDGKKYVCKSASGKGAAVIRNGFDADMAYRAGGIYAPDAKLYEFGDGKVYKLSQFIPGKTLIDVWKDADETTRDGIRKELLKGYPLDVLFSNYDVLGTSPEDSHTVTITGADGQLQKTHVAFNNIMVGDDGHLYRVDNDGAFAMTGTGGKKHSGEVALTVPVEYEHWDKWQDRQWIDDFRTLRRNEKNQGIFDRYSTADIFISAGNINFDAAVDNLPSDIKKALAKPLFEMKQMTWRAVNISLGGFRDNGFISMALDTSYEASKRGLRELCKKTVSWNDSGFGKYKKSWGAYQMQDFTGPAPEEPKDPRKKIAQKLPNSSYTGKKIIGILLNAVKTINHHGGVKQLDKDGNPLGNGTAMSNPDYKPNPSKIAEFEQIDREKLAELAKTDKAAADCLGIYDTIIYSKQNGWKKPIGQIATDLDIKASLPEGYQSPSEKKILDDMAGAIEQYKKEYEHYSTVALPQWEKKKSAHIKAEEEKAKKAGGSIFHNFHHFAEVVIGEGMNTDGVAHKIKTSGIAPIESSMHSQKGSSYSSDAVKWKVREMMALGYSPETILQMAKEGKLYNGSYYSTCIEKHLLPHREDWDRDMHSQAMYLGLNMVKMENEINDVYDKDSGVIFLNRNISNTPQGLTSAEQDIYQSHTKQGWVGPHVDSAADCMQFEKNSWSGEKKQVYAVPLSRIVCCANNETATGTHQDYGYGENEYVGNLYNLPCWVYHPKNNLTWKGAIDKAKESLGMKGFLKRFATRLGLFNTLTN